MRSGVLLRRRTFAAFAVVGLAAGTTAVADTVVLRNGRCMNGTVVREDERVVVLLVEGAGEMSFDRATVREVVRLTEPPPPARPPAEPRPAPASREPSPDRPKAPAPRAQQNAGGDVMASRRVWRVESGTIAAAFASLAQQAGLAYRPTADALSVLEKSTDRAYASEKERTFAEALATLRMSNTGLALGWRVRDGALEVGRKHEVVGALAQTENQGIVWDDDLGEVRNSFDPPNWRRPDLVALRADARDGRLELRLTFSEDVAPVLAQKTPQGQCKGYELASVYVDADDDPKTGRALSWDERRTGWEFEVDLSTGFEMRDGKGNTFSQWGNIQTIAGVHTVLRTLVTYSVRPLGSSGGATIRLRGDDADPEKLTTIRRNEITALVPYAALGIEKGRRVRLSFLDAQHPLIDDAKISQPGWLTLR